MDFNFFDNMMIDPDMRMGNRVQKCERSTFPENTPVGMAYVPLQAWETPFEEQVGFSRGTIFPSLDLPFCPGEEETEYVRRKR